MSILYRGRVIEKGLKRPVFETKKWGFSKLNGLGRDTG